MPSGLDADTLQSALPLDSADKGAGSRNLLAADGLAALVSTLRRRLYEAGLLAGEYRAIQCTLFRKTAECNWKVPYHQDVSVPVASRIRHPALAGWSVKEDGLYVQPPVALLQRLLAVRLHLDDCTAEAGALKVLPGSHRKGRIASHEIPNLRSRENEVVVESMAGEMLVMHPLLLHASSKARRPNGRRVLHFLFAPPAPGYGLSWGLAL